MLHLVAKRLGQSLFSLLAAIRLVWRSSPIISTILLILVVIQGIVPVLLLYTIGLMVDEVTTAMAKESFTLAENIIKVIILVGAVTLLEIIIGALAAMLNERQALSVSDHVMSTIHSQSILLDLEYYEDPSYYDVLHRVQIDAPTRPSQVVNNLLQTARQGFLLLGIIGLLIFTSPWVPIILIASALPSMLVRYYFSRKLYDWQHQRTEKERRSFYYHALLTYGIYAKELRLFETGNLFSSLYDRIRTELREERLRIIGRRTISDITTQSIAVIALFLTLLLVLSDVISQSITIGSFVVVFQAFQRGQTAIQSLLRNLATLYEHNLFLRDYQAFLNLKPKIISPANSIPIPKAVEQGIYFEDVSFHYPGKNNYIFTKVNLMIRPNEVIALVGENGAGKTTLIKLLCRLYDPTEGRITFEGIDIRLFDVYEWRDLIAVMFQDYNSYHMTVRENIWLSNSKITPDDVSIKQAAHSAGAAEMINNLEHQYDTMLGHSFAGGQELSIGQWQKLALARSFWKNASVVVLDEPTSSLDVTTEHEVFDRFEQIIDGRLAILISHRLSTIRMADQIYVLDHGTIAESGTHDMLIAQNGIYAHLFDLQSQHYTN